MNKHIGSDFDAFLEEEGLLAEVEAAAFKRVIAYQAGEQAKRSQSRKTETSGWADHKLGSE